MILKNKCKRLPWIPEPSTVNNKLKCREGSGIQGIAKDRHINKYNIVKDFPSFFCNILET